MKKKSLLLMISISIIFFFTIIGIFLILHTNKLNENTNTANINNEDKINLFEEDNTKDNLIDKEFTTIIDDDILTFAIKNPENLYYSVGYGWSEIKSDYDAEGFGISVQYIIKKFEPISQNKYANFGITDVTINENAQNVLVNEMSYYMFAHSFKPEIGKLENSEFIIDANLIKEFNVNSIDKIKQIEFALQMSNIDYYQKIRCNFDNEKITYTLLDN